MSQHEELVAIIHDFNTNSGLQRLRESLGSEIAHLNDQELSKVLLKHEWDLEATVSEVKTKLLSKHESTESKQ